MVFQVLKCEQNSLFASLFTLIKKMNDKKVVIYCHSKKVTEYFVDIFDYIKVESTVNINEYLCGECQIVLLNETSELRFQEINIDLIIFFDIPTDSMIEEIKSANIFTTTLAIFLYRECESEWVKKNIITELSAKELPLPKSALTNIDVQMKKGTKKLFALQRDAQLAYKDFMRTYAINGRSHLKELKLTATVNNFGLDIPPKINEYESLLETSSGISHMDEKPEKVEEIVPKKLRKIR